MPDPVSAAAPVQIAQGPRAQEGELRIIRGRGNSLRIDDEVAPTPEQVENQGRAIPLAPRPAMIAPEKKPVDWNGPVARQAAHELEPDRQAVSAMIRRLRFVGSGKQDLSALEAAEQRVDPAASEVRSGMHMRDAKHVDFIIAHLLASDDWLSREFGKRFAENREAIISGQRNRENGTEQERIAVEFFNRVTDSNGWNYVEKCVEVRAAQGYFDPLLYVQALTSPSTETRWKEYEAVLQKARHEGKEVPDELGKSIIDDVTAGETSAWDAHVFLQRAGGAQSVFGANVESAYRRASAKALEDIAQALRTEHTLDAVQDPAMRRQIQQSVAGLFQAARTDAVVNDPNLSALATRYWILDNVSRSINRQGMDSLERSVDTLTTTRDAAPLLIATLLVPEYGVPVAIDALLTCHFVFNQTTAVGNWVLGDGTLSDNCWNATLMSLDQTAREIPYVVAQGGGLALGGQNPMAIAGWSHVLSAPAVYAYDVNNPFNYAGKINYRPDQDFGRFLKQDMAYGTLFALASGAVAHHVTRLQGLPPGLVSAEASALQRAEHQAAQLMWHLKFLGLESAQIGGDVTGRLWMLHALQVDENLVRKTEANYAQPLPLGPDGALEYAPTYLDKSTIVNTIYQSLITSVPGSVNGYRSLMRDRILREHHQKIAVQMSDDVNVQLAAKGVKDRVRFVPVYGDADDRPIKITEHDGQKTIHVPIGLGSAVPHLPSPKDNPGLGMKLASLSVGGPIWETLAWPFVASYRGAFGANADTHEARMKSANAAGNETLARLYDQHLGNASNLDLNPLTRRIGSFLEGVETQFTRRVDREEFQKFRKALEGELGNLYVTARAARAKVDSMTAEEAADPAQAAARRAANFLEYGEEELGRFQTVRAKGDRLRDPVTSNTDPVDDTPLLTRITKGLKEGVDSAGDRLSQYGRNPLLAVQDVIGLPGRILQGIGYVGLTVPQMMLRGTLNGIADLHERGQGWAGGIVTWVDNFEAKHPLFAQPLRAALWVPDTLIAIPRQFLELIPVIRLAAAGTKAAAGGEHGQGFSDFWNARWFGGRQTDLQFGRVTSPESAAEVFRRSQEAAGVLRIGQDVETDLTAAVAQTPAGPQRVLLEQRLAAVKQMNARVQSEGVDHYDQMLKGYARGSFNDVAGRPYHWLRVAASKLNFPDAPPLETRRNLTGSAPNADFNRNAVQAAFRRAWDGASDFDPQIIQSGVMAKCRQVVTSNDDSSHQELINCISAIRKAYGDAPGTEGRRMVEQVAEMVRQARAGRGGAASLDEKLRACNLDDPDGAAPVTKELTPASMHREFVKSELEFRLKKSDDPVQFTNSLRLLVDMAGPSERDQVLKGVLKKLKDNIPDDDPRIKQIESVMGAEEKLYEIMFTKSAQNELNDALDGLTVGFGPSRARQIIQGLERSVRLFSNVEDGLPLRLLINDAGDLGAPTPTMRDFADEVIRTGGRGLNEDGQKALDALKDVRGRKDATPAEIHAAEQKLYQAIQGQGDTPLLRLLQSDPGDLAQRTAAVREYIEQMEQAGGAGLTGDVQKALKAFKAVLDRTVPDPSEVRTAEQQLYRAIRQQLADHPPDPIQMQRFLDAVPGRLAGLNPTPDASEPTIWSIVPRGNRGGPDDGSGAPGRRGGGTGPSSGNSGGSGNTPTNSGPTPTPGPTPATGGNPPAPTGGTNGTPTNLVMPARAPRYSSGTYRPGRAPGARGELGSKF